MISQATSSTGQSENRWWIPWWNQLRTWRCNNVYSTFHPFYFHVSQHFLNTFIFSFLDSCSLKSFLFLPTLSLKSDWSQIKGGCLQLILNYFKLFLLLPGEEVRNLRPVNPLSTHTQTNISLCPPFVNPHKDQCILCQPQTHLSWFSIKHASI